LEECGVRVKKEGLLKSENETLNFTRFNVIQNLQQFVTIGSKLIQNLNKELFAGGDHFRKKSVVI